MKNLTLAIILFTTLISNAIFAQIKRPPASFGREEYSEVERNVKLHVTDLGEGEPIVLIHEQNMFVTAAVNYRIW